MKKLMIALATVAVAAGVQAANFAWSNVATPVNAYGQPGDDGDLQSSGTMYLIDANTYGGQAFVTAVLGAGADAATMFASLVETYAINSGTLTDDSAFATSAKGTVSDGAATWTDSSYASGNVNFYQVLFDAGNNALYISETMEKAIQGTGDTELFFENNGSYDASLGANPFPAGTTTYDNANGGWYQTVPEPTSGLLLLLGVAGLALRRRRA